MALVGGIMMIFAIFIMRHLNRILNHRTTEFTRMQAPLAFHSGGNKALETDAPMRHCSTDALGI